MSRDDLDVDRGAREPRYGHEIAVTSQATEPLQPAWKVRLLGEFELRSEEATVSLAPVEQRLLAFLALQGRSMARSVVAATLCESPAGVHAASRLRTTVWKVRKAAPGVLIATREHLGVASSSTLDIDIARELARRLSSPDGGPLTGEALELLTHDVLPDWCDDWVVVERERFRQLRLHALETAARRLVATGRFQEAIDAAELAIAASPLRESAHRVLIEAHIAEGNWSEALAQHERCCRVLDEELGLAPTSAMGALVAGSPAIAWRRLGDETAP